MLPTIKNAIFAAVMAGVIIAPIFGLQIARSGMETYLEPDWTPVLWGMAIVFVFQLVRPQLARVVGRPGVKRRQIPPISESVRRGLLFVLLAIALIWPFFTGRA